MAFHMNLGGGTLTITSSAGMTYGGSTTFVNGKVTKSTAATTPQDVLPMARKHHEDLQGLRKRCQTEAQRAALDKAVAHSADLFGRIRLDGPMAEACMKASEMKQLYEDTLEQLDPPKAKSGHDPATAPGTRQTAEPDWKPLPAGHHGSVHFMKITSSGIFVADRPPRAASRASEAGKTPEALTKGADDALGRLKGFVAEINKRGTEADKATALDYQERADIHRRLLEEALTQKTQQGPKEAARQGAHLEKLAERASVLAARLR